jgi:hypothetical protein
MIIFFAFAGAIIFKYNTGKKEDENRTYALLERKGNVANGDEWKKTKEEQCY